MAIINTSHAATAFEGLQSLPFSRQVFLLLALAASIAIGVGVVLWAQKPDMQPLFSRLESQDTDSVIDALNQAKTHFSIDPNSGTVLVPSDQVQKVRIQLAGKGLPQGNAMGFEMLEKKSHFGTSQFMEMAQFVRALEGEMARTISGFSHIKSARVHLAIPKQTVFVNDKRNPSASVFVDLHAGRSLSKGEVDAIANLVAASVPQMQAEQVTIVDQRGHLLSHRGENDAFATTRQQLDLKQQIENNYAERIERILMPIVGAHRLRTEVSANVNFTVTEKTQEIFDPEGAIRSQNVLEEERGQGQSAGAVPGALANTPPIRASTVNNTPKTAGGEAANYQQANHPTQLVRQQSHHFELDKTISHTKSQPWELQRLSVAVAIDDFVMTDKAGHQTRKPLEKSQVERIERLVKDAIGFDEKRGDAVSVVNVAFNPPMAVGEIPASSFYQQPWFWSAVKYAVTTLSLLLLILGVLKPAIKNLTLNVENKQKAALQALDEQHKTPLPLEQLPYQDRMNAVKQMAQHEPARVAQVIKTWMGKPDE